MEAQDLHCGNASSVICILETQDLHPGHTRSVFWSTSVLILVCSQDKDLMDHTSQEWLNGVHLFAFHKNLTFCENVIFCMILHGPYKSGVAEWRPFICFSQKSNIFFQSMISIITVTKFMERIRQMELVRLFE